MGCYDIDNEKSQSCIIIFGVHNKLLIACTICFEVQSASVSWFLRNT